MRILLDRDIYEGFTLPHLVRAERLLWIATANIKGTGVMYRGRFVSLVDLLAILVNRGVSIRVIHAELPSRPFRERYEQLDAKGRLSAGVEFLHCIRMHAKVFIVDGEEETRPFVEYFDYIWMGGPCPDCGRRELCPAPPS